MGCFHNNGPKGAFVDVVPAEKKIAYVDIDYFVPHHLVDDDQDVTAPSGHQETRSDRIVTADHLHGTHRNVVNIMDDVKLLTQELNYLKKRQARHKRTVTDTYNRSLYWTGIETVLLMLVSVVQVIILRRMFESRQKRKQ